MKKPFALLWILAAALLIFCLFYLPTLSKYHDLKTQQEDYDKQIAKFTRDVKEMREERNLLKNDVEYLEKVIRGELGLVKPGEIVYKFVTDPPPVVEPLKEFIPAVSKLPLPLSSAATTGITVTAKPIAPALAVKTPAQLQVPPKTAASSQEPAYPRKETR